MSEIVRIKTLTPTPYQITDVSSDTHDTKTFRFALPPRATLDMLPGDYLYVHGTIDGKEIKRPYTPSSLPEVLGYFELTIKRYDTGTMSKHVHEKRVGDMVLISGPYPGGHWVDGMATRVGFVAGGTGITPMIAIIRWILTKRLAVELFLLFANKTEADIIFRDEWERDVRDYANFHCYHVLEQPPAGWTFGAGFITPDILRDHLPAPGPEAVVFLCGPPRMVDSIESALHTLGYPKNAIILP